MVRFLDDFGIEATKGDTIIMPFVVVNNDKSVYQVQTDDVINFGMKKNYSDAECIVEKTIDNTTLTLVLEHDDTKGLEVGAYYRSPEWWKLGQQKQTCHKPHVAQSQIPEDLWLR